MKILRDEKGQMLLLTVLSSIILFGFLAFATDVGLSFRAKRNLQIAADAAATAGALALHYGASTTASQDAYCAAYANGYEGSNVTYTCHNTVATNPTSASIYLNTPPAYGYHKSGGYFEAILTESNPTLFANMLGIHSLNISARAVAGTTASAKGCIWLGGTTGPDLTMQGSAYIGPTPGSTKPGCPIYVNASGSNAIKVTGGAADANVSAINVFGSGSGNPMPTGSPNYGAPAETNPFGTTITDGEPNLSASPSPCTQTIGGNSYTNQTLTVAVGSVVCFSGTNVDISGTTLTGSKGTTVGDLTTLGDNGSTFVFEHGVVTSNGGNSTVWDGTMDVDQGIFNEQTNALLNLTAPQVPTIGPDAVANPPWNNGIALLIPATNTQYTQTTCSHNPNDAQQVLLQFGSNNQDLNGYIYAPNATLTMHDQGGGVTASGIIAASLCLIPSTLVIPPYGSVYPYANPLTTVALVE